MRPRNISVLSMVAGGDDILQNSGDALRKGMRFSH
jgi:hypothetical protein